MSETATPKKTMPEIYESVVSISIDQDGIFPHQMISRSLGAEGHNMHAIMVYEPQEVYAYIKKVIDSEKTVELIYGLDRFRKPDQGITLGDFLGGAYMYDGVWKPFVLEYQHEPRIIQPICWTNEFWNKNIGRELREFLGVEL